MYHWYLPYSVFRFINLVSYGSITEECVLVVPGVVWLVYTLETAVVMEPVRSVMRATRIVG